MHGRWSAIFDLFGVRIMLDIRVIFVANELTPGLDNGNYMVPEGSTVRELIAACEEQCVSTVPEESFNLMYPLFCGKPVKMDTKLTKDGTMYFCRIVMGG